MIAWNLLWAALTPHPWKWSQFWIEYLTIKSCTFEEKFENMILLFYLFMRNFDHHILANLVNTRLGLVSSMITSARSIDTPLANIVFTWNLFRSARFWKVGADGQLYGQPVMTWVVRVDQFCIHSALNFGNYMHHGKLKITSVAWNDALKSS